MKLAVLLVASALSLSANEEFFDAARKGDIQTVKALLDKGVDVNAKWRYDQTALFIAARRGHTELVRLLIDRGAKVDVKDSFYGMTPVIGAAQEGKVEMLKLLIEKGGARADSVIGFAVARGNVEMVKMLLGTGSLKPESLSNALGAATAAKHTEIVKLLEEAGAKPPAEVKIDPSLLAKYAGSYKNAAGLEIKFETAEGKLRASMSGQTLDYRATSANTFEPLLYPGAVQVVFRTEGDKVTGIQVKQGDSVQEFARVEAK